MTRVVADIFARVKSIMVNGHKREESRKGGGEGDKMDTL